MKRNFKYIMIGCVMMGALSVTACGGKDNTKESVGNIVVESFAESKKDNETDGIIDGDVYTNKLFNIKFDAKAANMEMVNADELAAMSISHNDYSLKMEANSSDYQNRVDFTSLDEVTDLKAYIDEDISTIKE